MKRDQAIEQIKRQVPCTDYLRPAPNHRGDSGYCCPFDDCGSGTHGRGSTGAVKYYPETNTWCCHVCKRGGDVIAAYRAANDCDFNTALSVLSAIVGITIDQRPTAAEDFKNEADIDAQSAFFDEEVRQDDHREKNPQRSNIERTEAAADYTAYYEITSRMINSGEGCRYLFDRGITPEVAGMYGIGFDPASDPANAPGEIDPDKYRPHPAPRIIIPTSKSHYVGRRIDGRKEFDKINAKGSTPGIFNVDALHSDAEVIFVTEGAFDALSFLEAQFNYQFDETSEIPFSAIALNSKSNSDLLVKTLKERGATSSFIIVPDNDENPKTAADTMKRAAELNTSLLGMGYKSIVYNVAGKYHDANDAIIADRYGFEESINEAIRELQKPHDYLTDFLEKIQTEAYKPHPTGLNFFDRLLGGGIVNQTLLLLLAAPAAGKTTLIQQLAEAMAANQRPVIYLNFEMSREQMLSKVISAKAKKCGGDKSMTDILQGYKWSDGDREAITQIVEEYRRTNYPYIKYNPPGASNEITELLSFLTATGEAAKADGKQAPAVVVDYLHLITSKDGQDVSELVKTAIKGLHDYAVNYDTLVIAISAVNRESMKHGRITLNDGRDSSGIEYTGDYVISLNYVKIDNGEIKPGNVEKVSDLQNKPQRDMILRVLKNRAGQQGGKAYVQFDAVHNTFYPSASEFRVEDGGFSIDDSAPAFEDDSDVIMTI